MNSERRIFDTGISQSVAALPDPPAHWSYSTLKEIETCPRRYVLGHASYLDLWNGLGYPQLPHPAALFGDVVHDSLQRIIKALVISGCDSTCSPEAVSVLRDLGGYSVVAGKALDARLAQLDGNPRIDGNRRERLQRQLEDQIPNARAEIQGYLQCISLIPKSGNSGSTSTQAGAAGLGPRYTLGIGTHPEVSLRVDALRVKGRVDLLTVAADRVDIVDHKTGSEEPSHLVQLRFYAMLWDGDEEANSASTPLGELTASYPTHTVTITAPDEVELLALSESTRVRVAKADALVLADEPVATAGDHCHLCSVRSICGAYWQSIAPDPASLPGGKWFDFEGIVGEQNGTKSWWLLDPSSQKAVLLLRTTSRQQKLIPGQQVRLLGIRRDNDPEVESVVATLTANSEIFVVVGDSNEGVSL
jgi:hypothetical protein